MSSNTMVHRSTKSADVVLLYAPFLYPPKPSLALAMFKTALEEAGYQTATLYPMFRMIERMGPENLVTMQRMSVFTYYEEYIFSHLNGLKDEDDFDDYIAFLKQREPEYDLDPYVPIIRKAKEAATQLVEETAQEIVALSPKVLCASSLFTQHNASIAIMRRVKELNPAIKTLMGGPNCAGKAGVATLDLFPCLDAVFSGEGDDCFPQAIDALIHGKRFPYGVYDRQDAARMKAGVIPYPYRMIQDMDITPKPNFDDFMEVLQAAPEEVKQRLRGYMYGPNLELFILTEGSRGCWWAASSPCAFCSLNAGFKGYRVKSPQKVYDEVMEMCERYHTNFVEFTDNVLPPVFYKELLPKFVESGKQLFMFAEVIPTIGPFEMKLLKKAGITTVQPGIENLNDHILSLLNKRSTAAQSIYFLKNCRKYGLHPLWNMLNRVPGETKEDYEEMRVLLPKLTHLPPPTGISYISYQRESQYHKHQEKYGLKLTPHPVYRFLYGDHPEQIEALALYYVDEGPEEKRIDEETHEGRAKTKNLVLSWGRLHETGEIPKLTMGDRGDYLVIADTRPGRKMALVFLKSIARDILLYCDAPKKKEDVQAYLQVRYPQEIIDDCLQYLQNNDYLIQASGCFLSLPILEEAEEA